MKHFMRRATITLVVSVALTMSAVAGAYADAGQEGGYNSDGVNIRTDQYLWATSIGLGYSSQANCQHYYDLGDEVNGNPWWYNHTNVATGKRGWSHSSYLWYWDPAIACFT